MRHLQILVPQGRAERVLALAGDHEAVWSAVVAATSAEGEPRSLISLGLPNDRAGGLVDAVVGEIEGAEFLLNPRGILALQPPLSEVRQRVRNVSRRSSLELVLDSLQSLGSWRGMLLYALFSGVIAAYAVAFDTVYLLIAAMLIAPMGAPAMVSVIGMAIGEWSMFRQGMLRFAASIVVLVLTAAGFGLLVGTARSTEVMEQITSLSMWTALLAAVAGAAGAQSQAQSERASLVTGTATGFLVAAALSPTSAVLGLAMMIGRWDYAGLMAFQLFVQFTAIVGGGWLVLTIVGVSPGEPTAGRGSSRWRAGLASAVVGVTLVLVVLQSTLGPSYRKADLSSRAARVALAALESVPGLAPVEVDARFTRARLERYPGETLLVTLVVEDTGADVRQDGVARARVREAVRSEISREMPEVTVLVSVEVIPGADRGAASAPR